MEKNWTRTTKQLILFGSIVAFYLLISRVTNILAPLIITVILAYILSPIADYISTRLRLNRTLSVVIIYLVLVALIIIFPALLVQPLIDQIQGFIEDLPDLIQEFGEFIEQPLVIGDFTLDLQDVYDQTSSSVEGLLSSLGTQTISLLSDAASLLFWLVFVLVASFYLVKDWASVTRWVEEATPPAYRDDVRQLRMQIGGVWNAFLRGQLILCVVMGVVVGITMALIGLPSAWLIGLLFGTLEFIPNLGPTIASVPTVVIAFLEGSTILGLSNTWFAILVLGVNTVLQQLENHFLVPRIMGQSLHLHPVVVLVAAIIGANIAGVLGILLAAPVVATLRVLAEYTYYRLLDMPPFPQQSPPGQVQALENGITTEEEKTAQKTQPAAAAKGKQPE